MTRRWLIVAVGFALFVGLGEFLVWQFDANRRVEAENRLLSRLADARALLEAEVSEGIYITIGLEGFIQSQEGQPDFEEIGRWMESLFGHTRHLRNIGLAPDNRIDAVFPKEGNEGVIGVHYRNLPGQWGDVRNMMKTGDAILVGPIELIQGGKGLIYRRPVFVEENYWGLISTVMTFSSILDVIERFVESHQVEYRLSGITPAGPELIAGGFDATPMVSQSIELDFQGGLRWQMTMGERLYTRPLWLTRGLLWGLGLVIAFAVWQWWRSKEIAREAENRSVNERTEFIHSVSHELRTPLTSVRGAIGLLEQEDGGDPKRKQLLALASRNLGRLQRLVDEVMDLARLDGSRMELKAQPVNLVELVHQSVENNEHQARQHGLTLRTQIESGAETAEADLDRERFLQIMDNLLSNAVKFSDAGLTITIMADQRSDWAEVHVIDEGTGIPASFKHRIFERFAKADSSDRRRNQSGTGLGLSLVSELVLAMAGEIDVQSEEGKGTRVIIRFPLLKR